MNRKEVLKKAIEKAQNNLNDPYIPLISMYGQKNLDLLDNITQDGYVISPLFYRIIFSHEFAKAFWKENIGIVSTYEWNQKFDAGVKVKGFVKKTRKIELWQFHLQMMVLEEDPIKYLEKFL